MGRAISLLMVSLFSTAEAAFERNGSGGVRWSSVGNSGALGGSALGLFLNPAIAGDHTLRMLSVSIAPKRFGLDELTETSGVYIEPTSVGTFALSGVRFGFQLYRELTIGFSYARQVSDRMILGVRANYFSLSIQNYGSDQTLGFDAGGAIVLSSDLRWDFSAFNVNGPTIGEASERLPQGYWTALSYNPLDEVTLTADLFQDIRHPASLRFGVGYTIFNMLFLQCGTSLEPSMLDAGVGFKLALISLGYQMSLHSILGITHRFSVSIFPESL
jgi:hypothetical protein